MSFTCIICSDILNPTLEIRATTCGHLFHHICLLQWFERSKSCPQCRHKATEQSTIRLYVTSVNTSGIAEDVGSLQLRLDNALFQIKLKDVDIKKNSVKIVHERKQNELLRGEIQKYESERITAESVIRGLKEQIQYFKTKAKDTDKLHEEIKSLSTKLKDLENIDLVISGVKEQVMDVLKYNRDPKSLCLMVQTLKKELVEVERKRKLDNTTMKILKNTISKMEKESADLKTQIHDLKYNKEKYTPRLKPTDSPISLNSTTHNASSDSDCVLLNTPKQLSQPIMKKPLPIESANSIISLDSSFTPPIKSSSAGLACLINPRITQPSAPTKKPIGHLLMPKSKPLNSDYHYDGMGGHSKDFRFPEPQLSRSSPGIHGFKRHQPVMKSNNKHKVRKLAYKNLAECVSNSSIDDEGSSKAS